MKRYPGKTLAKVLQKISWQFENRPGEEIPIMGNFPSTAREKRSQNYRNRYQGIQKRWMGYRIYLEGILVGLVVTVRDQLNLLDKELVWIEVAVAQTAAAVSTGFAKSGLFDTVDGSFVDVAALMLVRQRL